MNRQLTQFWVAVVSVLFLGAATLLGLAGMAFGEVPDNMVTLFAGGLIGITGQATAYLFRLNGGPK